MTLPLSKEQIEAIQARAEKAKKHSMFIAEYRSSIDEHINALCQQALRAIELATKLAVTEFGFNTLERERDELQSDKDRLTKALEEIVGMTYAGAPDIYMKRIARAALSPPSTSQSEGEGLSDNCYCRKCISEHRARDIASGLVPTWSRMVLCPTCGNKRCPKASHHSNACTNSNEPGQPGSDYT